MAGSALISRYTFGVAVSERVRPGFTAVVGGWGSVGVPRPVLIALHCWTCCDVWYRRTSTDAKHLDISVVSSMGVRVQTPPDRVYPFCNSIGRVAWRRGKLLRHWRSTLLARDSGRRRPVQARGAIASRRSGPDSVCVELHRRHQ